MCLRFGVSGWRRWHICISTRLPNFFLRSRRSAGSCLLSVSPCSERPDDATTSSSLTSFIDVCLSVCRFAASPSTFHSLGALPKRTRNVSARKYPVFHIAPVTMMTTTLSPLTSNSSLSALPPSPRLPPLLYTPAGSVYASPVQNHPPPQMTISPKRTMLLPLYRASSRCIT